MTRPDLHARNRQSWNAATRAHNSHKHDQAGFLRAGGSTLFPEEIALLGDVRGARLLHLMCNSGQDTLSLAALGADATGVDISDEAIAFARQLSADSGIPATFWRADVYDWLDEAALAGDRYDIAFCSYGALCWLSDLESWARGVAAVLRPGGRFVCIEPHPFAMMFDEHWNLRFDYGRGAEPVEWKEGIADYVAASGEGLAPSGMTAGEPAFRNPHPAYEFQWGVAQIVSALLDAGLVLELLREYPFVNGWKGFDPMRALEDRRWATPDTMPALPLMLAVAARAPSDANGDRSTTASA